VAGPCPACDVSYASSLGLGIASADGLSAFVAATASLRWSAGSPRLSARRRERDSVDASSRG
jgi:hypothetical protein